ncbi:pollen-specific leucine-rich repeat extensin-like protein 4 [Iris pallida]|uniref:Pollen-specific leucine-rich repeat extensin-like protein 4 n=1 Tax=Iris pallida TaxID=29817 RepID=A0AAX6GSC8_IRIPA|nr:pollen-specific leucine-rich repeat extensin-like protein 4 [Iris pallida]KAJ6831247.1 pollen-specific leucine-rich repeat extensin-like protein 4 [Iris pallida]
MSPTRRRDQLGPRWRVDPPWIYRSPAAFPVRRPSRPLRLLADAVALSPTPNPLDRSLPTLIWRLLHVLTDCGSLSGIVLLVSQLRTSGKFSRDHS